jgi:hypothetical protein
MAFQPVLVGASILGAVPVGIGNGHAPTRNPRIDPTGPGRVTCSSARAATFNYTRDDFSARRVNQVMTKGNYGTQAQRYWAALRANINDLARRYNLTPMGT